MGNSFMLTEQRPQPVLSIRTKTSVEKLPQVIREAYQEIMKYLNELEELPAEAPFCAYYNLDMENLDVEMGFPVSKKLPGQNAIQCKEIPGGKRVSYMYRGPYKEMEKPYKEITRWINEKGLTPSGVSYEYYYNAPDEVLESELLTKIVFPVE